MRPIALLSPLLALALAACGSPPDDGGDEDAGNTGDAGASYDAGPDFDSAPNPDARPPAPAGGVDVLFVIDNSATMEAEQLALSNSISSFISELENANGGQLPSIQIGVTSTNLGAGPFNIANCSESDNGALLVPASQQCTGPDGVFISDLVNPDMSRTRNYTGDLNDVFECIALLGTLGCGFEQPLEAMRRALNGTNPGNAGFVRDDALLAVIIVSDEDDCSTEDIAMFDTSQSSLSDPLGPLSSYRCFEFGVVCDPDMPRQSGSRTSCVSREDSAYMFAVQDYVQFLQQLKPNNVVVATIQGPPTPVDVSFDQAQQLLLLDPSCMSGSGQAAPGIRLDQFIDGFPNSSATGSICSPIEVTMTSIATLIANRL